MSRKQAARPGGGILAAEPPAPAAERTVTSPFAVVVDTREQKPYTFQGLRANANQGNALIVVPTVRRALDVGDYSIDGIDWCRVERKSKEDLYGSVVRRDNFEGRLDRLAQVCSVAHVVVECEWLEMVMDPPYHSQLNPKALARTIAAWATRWPVVHWWFMPNRTAAEAWTFRLLETYWKAWQRGHTPDQTRFAAHMARPGGPPFGTLDEVQP